MQFKELKENYSLWVLDKAQMTCEEVRVVSVSMPRFENKIGGQPSMVVDVTVEGQRSEVGGQRTFVFPEGASKAYCGNVVYCIDKADAIGDIKVMQRASEQHIADTEKHREIVKRCAGMLAEIDTEEKAKQEMESRLKSMESRFDNIEDMLRRMIDESR